MPPSGRQPASAAGENERPTDCDSMFGLVWSCQLATGLPPSDINPQSGVKTVFAFNELEAKVVMGLRFFPRLGRERLSLSVQFLGLG